MRILIVICLLLVLMSIAGWIVFDFGGNSTRVEFRTDKMKQDTSDAVHQASESLKSAGDVINRP